MFNDVLDLETEDEWHAAGGIDFGDALVTKDGVAGDRELLFLGNPANRAAKIVRDRGLRLTSEVADLLPDDLFALLVETADEGIFSFWVAPERLKEVTAAHDFFWSREGSRSRLTKAAYGCSGDAVTIYDALVKIDKTKLGLSNSKRVEAVSLFADVDGFTAYIEDADASGMLPEAARSIT